MQGNSETDETLSESKVCSWHQIQEWRASVTVKSEVHILFHLLIINSGFLVSYTISKVTYIPGPWIIGTLGYLAYLRILF